MSKGCDSCMSCKRFKISPVGSSACVSLDTETSFASISKSKVIEGSGENDVNVDVLGSTGVFED